MFDKRHVRGDELDVGQLSRVWAGNAEDDYGAAAVVGTVAITLRMMGRARDRADAEAQAWAMWNQRNREKFQAAA